MKSLLPILFAFVAIGVHAQTIIYVKPLASGSGASWANACDLEAAMTKASAGSQVWVQSGTYYPSTMLTVPASVKLYGGFAGTETSVLQRDLDNNFTIIDAQNKYGSVIRLGVSAILNGFTIQNGNANHNPHKNGGGVWADDNTIIEDCIIINNFTQFNGGGVYAKGPVTLVKCTVENNTAVGKGSDTYGDCLTDVLCLGALIAMHPSPNEYIWGCDEPHFVVHPDKSEVLLGCDEPVFTLHPVKSQVELVCDEPIIATHPSKTQQFTFN